MICQVKNKLTVANFWYLAPKNILKKEKETDSFFATPMKNKIGGAIYIIHFFSLLAI